MLDLIFWILVFIVSLIVLLKAADFFLDSAQSIGVCLGIPKFVIGATIIAVGTSLPELVSSIFAVLQKSSEIVIGNVVGSNITNIAMILGIIASLYGTITIKREAFLKDTIIMVAVSILLVIVVWDRTFNIYEAMLFVVLFIAFNIYLLKSDPDKAKVDKECQDDNDKIALTTAAILLASILFIYLGAKYLIDAVIKISEIVNIGKEIIAVTAVAIGTSLPELIVSLLAYKKGEIEISLGNIIGSNIFNIVGIMGISALFGNLIIPESMLTLAIPVMLAIALLFLFAVLDRKVTRWEGILFLVIFFAFLAKAFNLF